MFRSFTLLCVFWLLLFPLASQALDQPAAVSFVQNKGQWADDVLYRADLPGGYLFLKKGSLHYVFYDAAAVGAIHTRRPAQPTARTSSTPPDESAKIRAHGVEMILEGSQTTQIEALKPSSQHINYLFGNDPKRWASDASLFGEIVYHDVYPGIDLRLFAYYQTLKYEFIVRPGADPSRIQLRYDGAERVKIDKEQLLIETSLLPFREAKPYSYTDQGDVATEWRVNGSTASFHFPKEFDKSKTLTVDPTLIFSTYSGSVSDNWGHTATYDTGGNLYSGGTAFGNQFPVSTGAYQVKFAEVVDVAIMKFSPNGQQLLYATYIGGRSVEVPHSIWVNAANELLILGSTASNNFPTSTNAFQRQFNGGSSITPMDGFEFTQGSDLFVAKLDATGRNLLAGTLIGGSANDGLGQVSQLQIRNYGDPFRGEVMTDAAGNVYVCSVTTSSNFPLVKPSRSTVAGGQEGVVFSLSPDLSVLQWSTLVGGDRYDALYGLKLAPSGALYVCGVSRSTDLPVHNQALNRQLGGTAGLEDGFVAKFVNQQLTNLTYLGTANADAAYLLDLDNEENVHVFGLTNGRYTTTDSVYRNANSCQFIHALDKTLSRTYFSTTVGSGRAAPDIAPTALLVNECGNIYLSGWGGIVNIRTINNTRSSTVGLPVTQGAFKTKTNGNNFWLAVLERKARSLLYATYFGSESPADSTEADRGDHVDGGTCRFDKSGVIYHAACACGGTRFPAPPQAWSRENRSTNCNNAAFKFDIDRLKAAFDTYEGTKKGVVEGCAPLSLTFVNTSEGGITYEWDFSGRGTSTNPAQATHTFDKAGEYTIVLKAYNKMTCKVVDVAQQVIKIFPASFKVSADTSICAGRSIQLKAEGATTYAWNPSPTLSSTTIANPIATPETTTPYTVTMTNQYGCRVQRTVTVQIDDSFKPAVELQTSNDCGKPMQVQLTNRTQGADSFRWVMGNGDTLSTANIDPYQYPHSGQYTITATAYKNGCSISLNLPVEVENLGEIPNVVTANNDGKNDIFNVGFSGAQLEIFNRWGKLIYRADSYANNWGNNAAHGTYYYLLTTPKGVKCKGWVEVLK
ncbi:DUF7948 domain-containing protein [Tellurirhabdus bombi]|uniref:DUF7948 domain-containing protein n=1 Tax=Tellurirhabdus bombi TaxID=2907205 RepID=UPI001F2AFA68|nr:gliding motility-associated C-terminal domain-containing protein [Tellurirhabdus bombi]